MTARLVIEKLSKSFSLPKGPVVAALNSLDLVIEPGELFVLLGPSGSGKSTTLRLIAGLEAPSSGTIHFEGQRIDLLPPKERDISMVFQSPALYPQMNVEENLGFALKLRGLPASKRNDRVAPIAKLLGVGPLLHRAPETLSGGEQQRISLGRALVTEPKIFLLDEPFSNLDAPARALARRDLKALQRKLGVTMIYVTHDQSEAMALGDRIAILDKGQLQQVGPPEELYHLPRNLFVADFFGSPAMNLLEGRLLSQNDLHFLEMDKFHLPFPLLSPGQKLKSGSLISAAIRAENVHLVTHPNGLSATVSWVENFGWETWAGCKLGAREIVARLPANQIPKPGSDTFIEFASEGWRLFDPQTTMRID